VSPLHSIKGTIMIPVNPQFNAACRNCEFCTGR